MEFRELAKARASVRKFKSDPIPKADLKEMARIAGLAPSANNSQPWKFIAITNKDILNCLASAVSEKIHKVFPQTDDEEKRKIIAQVDYFSTFFIDAPAVIAVLGSPYEAIVDKALESAGLSHAQINEMRGYPDIQSRGAAVQNLLLAATDMGYGSCWLSGPMIARDELEKCLDVNAPWHLAAMVAIGKPAGEFKQRDKKPVDEIFEIKV